ncbi:MAG: hypothetical protein FWE32_05670 [Oscillospiraceae bacterium]|nr:hypothetical protein [Oscillospiraceae bacterium]
MIYGEMRGILEDARDLLGVLFEHGLASAAPISKELEEQQRIFAGAGLSHGEKLLEELRGVLDANRLSTAGNCERAAGLVTELWRYTSSCLYKLDFAQAESESAASKTQA